METWRSPRMPDRAGRCWPPRPPRNWWTWPSAPPVSATPSMPAAACSGRQTAARAGRPSARERAAGIGGGGHRRTDRSAAGTGGHQPRRRRRSLRTGHGAGGRPGAGVRIRVGWQHHLRVRCGHPHPHPIQRRRRTLERDPDAAGPQEEQGEEDQGQPGCVDTERGIHQRQRRIAARRSGASVEHAQRRAQLESADLGGDRTRRAAGLRQPHRGLHERVLVRRGLQRRLHPQDYRRRRQLASPGADARLDLRGWARGEQRPERRGAGRRHFGERCS